MHINNYRNDIDFFAAFSTKLPRSSHFCKNNVRVEQRPVKKRNLITLSGGKCDKFERMQPSPGTDFKSHGRSHGKSHGRSRDDTKESGIKSYPHLSNEIYCKYLFTGKYHKYLL